MDEDNSVFAYSIVFIAVIGLVALFTLWKSSGNGVALPPPTDALQSQLYYDDLFRFR